MNSQVHFLLRKNTSWKGDDKNETYRKLHNSIVNTLKPDQEELESGEYDGDYADGDEYNGNVLAWFNRYGCCNPTRASRTASAP